MSISERDVLLRATDSSRNSVIMYPITKADNVDGLDEQIKNYVFQSMNSFLEIMYPIGYIYLSTSATPPNSLFGGTWEQIKDVFLLSSGDNYVAGETGGSVSHNHEYGFQYGAYVGEVLLEGNSNAGVLNYSSDNTVSVASQQQEGSHSAVVNGSTTTASSSKNSTHYRTTGSTSTTNNMPPYLTVYMWKRTG